MPMRSAFVGTLLCAGAACGQTTFFDNVRVFDGRRGLGVRDVLVVDGEITAVSRRVDVAGLGEGAEIIDGTGRTLMPGMIDGHTHTWQASHLETAADLGVTTTLDMFTAPQIARSLRERLAGEGGHEYADLKTSMVLLTARGGHGTQFGIEVDTVDRVEDVEPFVAEQLDENGADYLKIILEDGSEYGSNLNTITPEVLRAAVEAAHKRGKLAVAHVSTTKWADEAVAAGVDVLVHVFSDRVVDAEWGERMRSKGMAMTPTLAVMASVANAQEWKGVADDTRLSEHLNGEALGGLARTFGRATGMGPLERSIENVRVLHAAGVPIIAGTDAPNPGTAHGASMHQELVLLTRAGLTNEEALAAATGVPSSVFGLDDRGMIEEGRRADLLLVEGNPMEDLDATRDIVGVWRGGKKVDRTPVEQPKPRAAKGDGPDAPGLVSDFNDGTMASSLGAGWSASTDAMMGGKSTATLDVVVGDGQGWMRVTGEIAGGSPNPWAGPQLSPGAGPFRPADLSGAGGLSFRARGDGRTYALVVFSESRGFQPAFWMFTPGKGGWTDHRVTWDELGGLDGSDITSIVFSAGAPAGGFVLELDDVVIE
jgi:imidazolonepropionase-like amidohydrolase